MKPLKFKYPYIDTPDWTTNVIMGKYRDLEFLLGKKLSRSIVWEIMEKKRMKSSRS